MLIITAIFMNFLLQIISPHDKGIAASILEHLQPEESSWDLTQLQSRLAKDPCAELWEAYMDTVTKLSFSRLELCFNP